MSDPHATITRVTGGGRIELPYADVRALADRVQVSGERSLGRAKRTGAVALSPHLMASAVFSPHTAAVAEGAITAAGAALAAWSGSVVLDAASARRAAALLADADQSAHLALHDLEATLGALYGRESTPPDVATTGQQVPASTTSPTDLTGLIEHQEQVSGLSGEGEAGSNGTVEVQTVTAADGGRRHIVYLPGLDDLDPFSLDGDVRDVGAAVSLEAGLPTAYGAGVVEAMQQAGVRPDEPVLLVGHSQGGMQAAALAAQGTPFHITQALTLGSPQVPGDVPDGVHVLSLQHQGDPVHMLDFGASDHDPHHVTVTVDSGSTASWSDPTSDHDFPHYLAAGAAAEASTDPVVQSAVGDLDPFLAHPGDVAHGTVFQITRGDDPTAVSLLGAAVVSTPVGAIEQLR